MKKILLLLTLSLSCFISAQTNNNALYKKIDAELINLKGNISYLRETSFTSDYKTGELRKDWEYDYEYFFDKKQNVVKNIFKTENYKRGENKEMVREVWEKICNYTYEEYPTYLKKGNISSTKRGANATTSNSQEIFLKKGNSILRKAYNGEYKPDISMINDNKNILIEYVLNDKNQVVTEYEYNYTTDEKGMRSYKYEYDSKGLMISRTNLKYDKPTEILKFKYNEHGDAIEIIYFKVSGFNIKDMKREYVYVYDKNNNWTSKKELFYLFNSDGTIFGDGKPNISLRKREIKYFPK